MKHLIFVLALLIAIPLAAQEEDNGYVMYQTILLTPKDGHGQQLMEGLKAHNDKFHQEGAESVNVWAIRSGLRSGSMLWVKGPRTWTDMDTPIEGDAHLDDWRANVTPHADIGEWEFWRLLDGMSYIPDDLNPGLIVMRYFDIKPQKWGNAVDLWKNSFQLYEDKDWDTGLQIFNNQVNAGDGRDWAVLWFHENWASMDKSRNFWSQYDEMFGIDRGEYFERWNEMAEFKGMEILVLLPELSIAGSDE